MDILPGLPRTQRNAIVARAYERFNDMPDERHNLGFDEIVAGNLHVITFRYKSGYVPLNPQRRDVSAMLGGGYAQDHVLVSVVKTVKRLGSDEMEVQLETPVCMSHKNGPTVPSDRFSLHRDGHVKFFPNESDTTRDWSCYQPHWEHTRYPVLPVVVMGCDLPAPPPAPAAGAAKRRRT